MRSAISRLPTLSCARVRRAELSALMAKSIRPRRDFRSTSNRKLARAYASDAMLMATQRFVLTVFLLSLGVALWRVVADPSGWSILAALLGWFMADMASGLIHMYMDYRPCPT